MIVVLFRLDSAKVILFLIIQPNCNKNVRKNFNLSKHRILKPHIKPCIKINSGHRIAIIYLVLCIQQIISGNK